MIAEYQCARLTFLHTIMSYIGKLNMQRQKLCKLDFRRYGVGFKATSLFDDYAMNYPSIIHNIIILSSNYFDLPWIWTCVV